MKVRKVYGILNCLVISGMIMYAIMFSLDVYIARYMFAITLAVHAALLTAYGVTYLIERWHYDKSFAKEIQDFIKGPKYLGKATNTEQNELVVDDLTLDKLKEDSEVPLDKDEPVTDDLIDFNNDIDLSCGNQKDVKLSASLLPMNFPDNHKVTGGESSTSTQPHGSRQSLYPNLPASPNADLDFIIQGQIKNMKANLEY